MTLLSLGAAPAIPLLLAIGVPVTALALVLTGRAIRRRKARPQKRFGSPAVKAAALAALGCTAYSADTSWAFAADYLAMAGTAERAALFGVAELALFAMALMARQNLAVQGAPGLPGTLVWGITGVQVIPAYAESGPVGGTVRAIVGPIMAAVLWHQAMGIELRLHTPGAASHGLIATLGREARERLLSRLGIAARDRDAAQITRDRATARAVALAARLAERTPEQHGWHSRRLARRLSKAIGRAAVGTDPVQRGELLDQLAARRHALALATVPLPSPWPSHHVSTTTATPPSPQDSTTVPVDNPHADTRPVGDQGPRQEEGPVPRAGDHDAGTGDHIPGIETGAGGCSSGTETVKLRVNEDLGGFAGSGHPAAEAPTHAQERRRGPEATEAGTGPAGDRGPNDTDTGTGPAGDRGHKAPLRRKPTARAKSKHGGRSRSPQTQRPPRGPEQSVEQLVQQVRPHVPALLERDGNEAVTRVQLREILRREGLKGGRNDRLSLVLQQLRSDASTTKARSTTR
ncbi:MULTISPECIES: collagen-like domain-containing protein [Streptomyces]|uniref:DUF2637 domain-containing protein n=2 Tax=Streptomyces rimosus subsp. rimosus TaxID=132474 RepID=L8EZC6_STRR1|nr:MULTISPECIES: hypothetical protein [Streptomyces]KOG74970.1 membrane protein [Kitasatospora aureofaciens]MYT41830.1 hypothetical protein [Streptomyces sp. SID5471]KOT41772.1 membrane protein [Streptomyces sp. NRRL WC-3701]KOT43930.1 membrane protein [Streptomyces rimosus subsp. rimosus]KOT67266.1 membrane protein [Streptomyces rimosus subsp. rimosus]